jgi:hypothetical protein
MKWLVRSAHQYLPTLAFVPLLALSAAVAGADRDEIVYDMVVTISAGSDIDHVDRVEVRFNNPPFYWDVGVLPEGDRALHSDVQPRIVPKALLLSWEENGERYEAPFTIMMPSADLLESTRTSGIVIDGLIVKSKLELLVEISPDSNTARVYWRVDRMPRTSRPKELTPHAVRR